MLLYKPNTRNYASTAESVHLAMAWSSVPRGQIFRIGTVRQAEGLWHMCRHELVIAHCTDSEDFPYPVPKCLPWCWSVHKEVSVRHFGTCADMPRQFGTVVMWHVRHVMCVVCTGGQLNLRGGACESVDLIFQLSDWSVTVWLRSTNSL